MTMSPPPLITANDSNLLVLTSNMELVANAICHFAATGTLLSVIHFALMLILVRLHFVQRGLNFILDHVPRHKNMLSTILMVLDIVFVAFSMLICPVMFPGNLVRSIGYPILFACWIVCFADYDCLMLRSLNFANINVLESKGKLKSSYGLQRKTFKQAESPYMLAGGVWSSMIVTDFAMKAAMQKHLLKMCTGGKSTNEDGDPANYSLYKDTPMSNKFQENLALYKKQDFVAVMASCEELLQRSYVPNYWWAFLFPSWVKRFGPFGFTLTRLTFQGVFCNACTMGWCTRTFVADLCAEIAVICGLDVAFVMFDQVTLVRQEDGEARNNYINSLRFISDAKERVIVYREEEKAYYDSANVDVFGDYQTRCPARHLVKGLYLSQPQFAASCPIKRRQG